LKCSNFISIILISNFLFYSYRLMLPSMKIKNDAQIQYGRQNVLSSKTWVLDFLKFKIWRTVNFFINFFFESSKWPKNSIWRQKLLFANFLFFNLLWVKIRLQRKNFFKKIQNGGIIQHRWLHFSKFIAQPMFQFFDMLYSKCYVNINYILPSQK
jgi:hypothetical protein